MVEFYKIICILSLSDNLSKLKKSIFSEFSQKYHFGNRQADNLAMMAEYILFDIS